MADGTGSVLFAALCLSMIMPLMAQAAGSHSNPSAPAEKFAQLSDQFMKDSLALSPVNASAAGYHEHLDPKPGKAVELDGMLDDMSLESTARQSAFYQQGRERFRKETPPASLDAQDAADWQLIDDQIGLALLE